MKEDRVLKRLDKIDEQHSQQLLDHSEQLQFLREHMLSRTEFERFRQEYLHGQDQIMAILKRLDEDRLLFMFA